MIIVRMSGGLGNQMFQYALYRKLLSLGRTVRMDDFTEYEMEREKDLVGNRRPLGLQHFGITYERCTREELTDLTDARMDPVSRVRRKLFGRHSLEIRDRDFVFDPVFLEREDGVFSGCFQSPKYFEGIEDELRSAFSFPEAVREPDTSARALRQRIEESGRSIAVHLRFGDYLGKQEVYGGICTDDYYAAAIGMLRRDYPEAKVFLFSDDYERALAFAGRMTERGVFAAGDFTAVVPRAEDSCVTDLYLMHCCDDFVTANSSFSFWAAFLGEAKDKRIAVPSFWNNQRDGSALQRADIYTKDMIRVSPRGELPDEEPLISVIVAAYNASAHIEACIGSLFTQTWKNLEVIAVDDGSSDDTYALLEKMAGEDGRLKVFRQANAGPSAARNLGLSKARGQFIAYCDADDTMEPECLETMHGALRLSGADLGITAYREVFAGEEDSAGSGIPAALPQEHIRRCRLLTGGEAMETLVCGGIGVPSTRITFYHACWSQLVRREVLDGITFEPGRLSEDILYTTEVIGASKSVVYCPDALYRYTAERSSSIMHVKVEERRLHHEISAWEAHRAYLAGHGFEKLLPLADAVLGRRLLYYWEEAVSVKPSERQESGAAAFYRDYMGKHKSAIREGLKDRAHVRTGDRVRLEIFLASPALYRLFAGLYAAVLTLRGKGR